MSEPNQLQIQQLWLSILIIFPHLFLPTLGDLGTASHYRPPYTPTACFGNDPTQFPSSGFFAAAGEGIWDNGASCGRQYLVKCISGPLKITCTSDTIQVRIVDRAQTSVSRPSKTGTSIVLSNAAFGAIANPSVASINLEFQQ
ncbi:hypothetical protein LIER_16856 [Lithospermum erythrorhizon]|uniref:Expansin-like EG45 domain-containing protein n=1 Tax=Lithospermum erythrorhizon TaxID=34254 RepID=A0AAV3QCC1_LITER